MPNERSLKDMIYDQILEGILEYEFKPNQILTEKELVAKYGCSKSPVREALISLCNDGVLRNIPRCGYEVIRLTMEDTADVQEFRRVLESGILRKNYQRITPRHIKRLRELDAKCCESLDMFQHWQHVTAFHLYLMNCSGNQFAYRQLEKAMAVLRRAYAQFYWDRWDATAPPPDTVNHERILQFLESGNIEEAIQALHDDMDDFIDLEAKL